MNIFGGILSVGLIFSALSLSAVEKLEFNRDIRPILSDRCFKCHGPDENTREAGLRLDTFEGATALLKNSDRFHVIVPGKPAESEFMHRITTEDEDDLMPPRKSQLKLSKAEIEILKIWIEQGAEYQMHWAFMPVRRAKVPKVSNEKWCRNPIDNFIMRRLDKEGLKPSGQADKLTLLKRVTFDLTGLPPTPEEIDDFLNDHSSKAFEKVVDRLLASDAYGERMALIWVDAARYADTSGYQADWERFMWPWREWAIKAYNRNLPFDEFTIEQLAGDLLENPSMDQKIATAFNRNHRINDEGGIIAEEFLVEYVVDRVETVSTVWMGMTMGCARCHDHKYDPLSQEEFYQFYSFFNNVPEKGKDGRKGYAVPAIDYPLPGKHDLYIEAKGALDHLVANSNRIDPDMRNEWREKLRGQLRKGPSGWNAVTVLDAEASSGLKLKKLNDGSIKVQPPEADRPNFEITARLAVGDVTAIRLDVLPDKEWNGLGLSPSRNGNYLLTDFEVFLKDPATAELSKMTIKKAVADFEQKNRGIKYAIDDDPDTGWGVMRADPMVGRQAVFVLESPVKNVADNEWVIRMKHNSEYALHYIGWFSLSSTAQSSPGLDKDSMSEEVRRGIQARRETPEQTELIDAYFRKTHPSFKKTRATIAAKKKEVEKLKAASFVKVMVMEEMEKPRPTFVLNRGLYDQPDKDRPVSAKVPAVFGEISKKERPDRLDLAKWLVSGEHPLSGRVTVNRYWQTYFGRGLVETAEDFGAQGSLPSHPELLDWLSDEFVEMDWDIKGMQKLIVMSATYQQSSKVTPALLEADPKNILLARGPRFRLSGYQIRDQALAVSGLLVNKLGGPSVKPYQPPGLWAEVSFQDKKRSTDFFVQDTGEKLYRRSLYTFWKRSVAPPQMATFDAAGREACAVRLVRTSTPLQALTLMNDVTFLEAARHMAERMMEHAETPDERIAYGLKLVSIDATTKTVGLLRSGLDDYLAHFKAAPADAKNLVKIGESPNQGHLKDVDHAAYMVLASVILNLDQTVTKE